MKLETPRDLALRVLNGLTHKSAFSGDALNDLFQSHPALDGREKAFIRHLVQGVLRWRLRLDWIVGQTADFPAKRISPTVMNILRLAVYQIFFLDRVPESAAVNQAVEQAKRGHRGHVVSFVNGILRAICREKDRILYPDRRRDPLLFLSVYYSYPEWLVAKWIREWGVEFTEALLEAGNRLPSLTLRTNSLRLDRESLIQRLREEETAGKPTTYSPHGVFLEHFRGRPDELASFTEGLFQVQDEAAQIVSFLLAPQPGENVLDLCAGFGGKTTHLAQLMGDRGLIVALDISRRRLIGLSSTCTRLGIRCTASVAADGTRSLPSLFKFGFHRIMVDAPCSGLGVISRNPDAKWRKEKQDIERMSRLQKDLLDRAASLLLPEGSMMYVTCTLSQEENEGVVSGFLENHRSFVLQDLRDCAPGWARDLIDDQGFFRTFPHLHGMDGFFAALFTKIK
ncbi:MAG: 16S rRNA (cytosine(967)-C(5))-methyltransferase RsmB [Deltaproteobacteria bacterium]